MTDSTEKLALVLQNLGNDGIQAYYVYLFLDYTSLWVVIGLLVWAVRTAYNARGNL